MNNDGWVSHAGGRRPVARNEVVEVKAAGGETLRGLADEFYWGEDIEPEGRIAAYRVMRLSVVVPPQPEAAPVFKSVLGAHGWSGASHMTQVVAAYPNAQCLQDVDRKGFADEFKVFMDAPIGQRIEASPLGVGPTAYDAWADTASKLSAPVCAGPSP